MPGSILSGVDGSPGARVALRHAAHLAESLGSRLVVAHVVQPPLPSAGGFGMVQPEPLPLHDLVDAGEALVARVLGDEGLEDVESRVVVGVPSDRLAALAEEEDADLIVVGSRGRGAFTSAFLGSVSSDLLSRARRPVVVVPPAARAARPSSGRRAPRAALGFGA